MFRKYGILGIFLIVFAEFVIFLRIEPFSTWYIPIIWLGYIFFIDSIVFMLKGNSLISNKPKKFLIFMVASIAFWYLFEFYNKFLHGWYYSGLPESTFLKYAMGTLSFATIVPAVFETWELVRQFHWFDKIKIKVKFIANKKFLIASAIVGFIFVTFPFFLPMPIMWAFVWTGFVLLLDPIMYLLHDEKSLIGQIKKGKYNIVLSLFVAGYICGFLWEFWNHWAYTRWYYTVPILNNFRIFEIPVLGFLAYGPFAWELYIMYQFVKFLLSQKFWNFLK